MEIKSLRSVTLENIYQAFSSAFSDYEMQLDSAQLQTMLKRRGFDPELSFAAFVGEKILSFTLNGIGAFDGKATAYDTGTGTLKEYRGKGLATAIFEHSIPHLTKRGIEQYLLEVLQHNCGAVSVYRKLGFETTREFYYFNQNCEKVAVKIKEPAFPYLIEPFDLDMERDRIMNFWDFKPSWQNSFESIARSREDFVCLGFFTENRLRGYCVFEPSSGDITQIAVDKKYRRKGIASLLLREIIRLIRSGTIKVINTDVHCESLTGFLEAKNINPKGRQCEMVKKLSF